MYLKKLKLQNFRNHKDTELVFSDGLNFFIGNNGEGKTNLLEAIHSISTFKSFRGNSNRELTLWDDSFFYIKAEFESLGEDKRIEFAFQKLDKDKIKMKLNGEAVTKKVDLVGEFKSIIYSPVDMEIIEGGPKKRRKFLDTLIAGFDRRYYKNLLEYNGILKRRNTLLKKRQVLKAELFPWNKLLVERGTLIQEIRSKYALQLNEYFK
ncbi:MAG: DNA replication/repair protein RecF, partial [Leptospiraceae bacterium]|nr:DNA replication/repair protein RecF [Leptospiraceae bacterium]